MFPAIPPQIKWVLDVQLAICASKGINLRGISAFGWKEPEESNAYFDPTGRYPKLISNLSLNSNPNPDPDPDRYLFRIINPTLATRNYTKPPHNPTLVPGRSPGRGGGGGGDPPPQYQNPPQGNPPPMDVHSEAMAGGRAAQQRNQVNKNASLK